MADEQMSPDDQEEMRQIAGLVAKSLDEGKSAEETAQLLVENGWEQEAADKFVGSIAVSLANARYHAAQAESAKSNDGGGMGWLVWIGLLVLINFLSYVFNWPFWIY